MTHDPLCPWGFIDALSTSCHMCDVIASVREDERKRAMFIAQHSINDTYDRDDAIAWINGEAPQWWDGGVA